jgi:hypothetical protein
MHSEVDFCSDPFLALSTGTLELRADGNDKENINI